MDPEGDEDPDKTWVFRDPVSRFLTDVSHLIIHDSMLPGALSHIPAITETFHDGNWLIPA
jgi:hypothetical protein